MPRPISPATGANIVWSSQPVTLVVANAVSTGQGQRTYLFEVATDEQFTNKVWTKDGVAEGSGGQTSVKVDTTLAGGRGYYWRARVTESSVAGPYGTVNFNMGPAVTVEAPQLVSPAMDESTSTKPTLTWNNATRTGPVTEIWYRIEIADNSGFNPLILTDDVPEQAGTQTSYTPTQDLPTGKTLYWHVRTTDRGSNITSSFTNTRRFQAMQGIDLSQVVYVKGPNISRWVQGSTITSVDQGGGRLCIYHTMLGRWPTADFMGDPSVQVEGNQWVFAFINGKWYGGAADWYRPGQACKDVDAYGIGGDAFYNPSEEPLHSWVPRPGELVGYLSSTPARLWPDMKTVDQRTDVVIVPWR